VEILHNSPERSTYPLSAFATHGNANVMDFEETYFYNPPPLYYNSQNEAFQVNAMIRGTLNG
jgi:hypothetical protein